MSVIFKTVFQLSQSNFDFMYAGPSRNFMFDYNFKYEKNIIYRKIYF